MLDIREVVARVGEPVRSYNFVVYLPSDFGNADLLKYQLISVEVPLFHSFETEGMPYAPSLPLPLPSGFNSFPEATLTFWENENFDVYNYFSRWKNSVAYFDDFSTYFMNHKFRKQYVKDVKVEVLSVDGRVVGCFTLLEAFPTSLNNITFSYRESELLTVEVTFVCRRVNFERRR